MFYCTLLHFILFNFIAQFAAARCVSLPLLTNTIGPPAMVMSVMTMHAGNLSATATKLFIHSSASLGDLALISLTISSNFEFRPGDTEKSQN